MNKRTSEAQTELARFCVDVDVRAGDESADGVIKNAVASDETLDSHGTVIKADGWDLERYSKNPVLIWAHKASGLFTEPEPDDVLGTANVRVSGNKLLADLNFDMGSEKAAEVYRKMNAKVIRALSVGFRPREWHYEDRGDREITVITKAELAELSVVPIPSNPNTLARSIRELCPKADPEPSPGEKGAAMADQNTPVFPASVAKLLGVDTEDAAVREISKLQLELDNSRKAELAATERAEKAEKDLQDRIDTETVRDVESRISAGVISEERRDAALALARADRGAFLEMYPHAEAPKAAELTRKVTPEEKPEKSTPTQEIEVKFDLVPKRAAELRKQGLSNVEATSRALADVLSGAYTGESK